MTTAELEALRQKLYDKLMSLELQASYSQDGKSVSYTEQWVALITQIEKVDQLIARSQPSWVRTEVQVLK